jgi:hypothetical protein
VFVKGSGKEASMSGNLMYRASFATGSFVLKESSQDSRLTQTAATGDSMPTESRKPLLPRGKAGAKLDSKKFAERMLKKYPVILSELAK